ncbi:glycoside hydrolase family 32 protein [Lachnoclostridium sp. An118]|uniref:glycoside hydrolase family 32 protein n=1 Tax=Lachnoclostridium sp. An118 TaxID=1965547 RepID=UPI000B382BD7|nr:glycoside hydrolase family 32 protein [Lachnoclostridium sp. An118]OUQ52080.1 sucrose-6-phosphate hydrolase [Lachnoclostridium sp. An118]HJA42586.1 glycoside hydrolase family 32 protein [Candidatus Dorea stercoravium]
MKTQRLHLKAPDNWVNDPNGFIYYKGYYHLFYQYFPYGPRWGTMHWGHAVSRDLVTWEHRDLALYPTMREDRNGCFSGSAVEKDGKLYLIYTGVRYEVVNPEDPHTCLDDQFESAQLMISSEDGFHFDNENGKKVIIPPITDPAIGDRTHTRDPKVWKSGDHWYLVLGSTVGEKYGEVLFYRSDDLHTWTYVDKAFKGPEYGWMWECPDYFETKGGKVLILSAMGFLKNGEKEKNQSICFHVEFDQSSCRIEIPDTYQFLDCGLDLYAPQTTLDAEGRRILSAWVRMPKVTDEGWIGMFCTPRVVEVRDGHIFFPMHPNVRAAYSQEIPAGSQRAKDGYLVSLDLEDGEELDVGGFVIRREGDRICTDRSAVFPSFPGAHLRSETPALKGGCHLDVVVDKDLVEVFVNEGECVISNAVYGLEDKIGCSGEGKKMRMHIFSAQR